MATATATPTSPQPAPAETRHELSQDQEMRLKLVLAESTPRNRAAIEEALAVVGYEVVREGRKTSIRHQTPR